MSICYFCEFCDFYSEEEFSAAQLMEHLNKKHACKGYVKNCQTIPCPSIYHHGPNKGLEKLCTSSRKRSLLCCVCEKTYSTTAEYIGCIKQHAKSEFVQAVEEMEQLNESVNPIQANLPSNYDNEVLCVLETMESESETFRVATNESASLLEFQPNKRKCVKDIRTEEMQIENICVVVPETQSEVSIVDDAQNDPAITTATQIPDDLRFWRSVLPGDPIVKCPGIDGDFRECVSPIDTEDELDDLHPNIQVGCGVNDSMSTQQQKPAQDTQTLKQDDNGDVRFVNDMNALKLKECKFCQDGKKYGTVGALLDHIKCTHDAIYRKYLETIQTGEGLDENSPNFEISLKIATKDNITQNFVVDISAQTKTDNRPIHWTDFNAFMKALIKSLSTKLKNIYKKPLYHNGMRINQFKVLFQSESLYSRPDSEEVHQRHAYCSPMYFIRQPEDVYDSISLMIAYFMQRNDEHTIYGSGWVHERVLDFQFTITRAKVMDGTGSYDLPSLLVGKIKSLFNVIGNGSLEDESNRCFMHSIISQFEMCKIRTRGSSTYKKFKTAKYYDDLFDKKGGIFTYKTSDLKRPGFDKFVNILSEEITIDFTGIKFPFSLTQLKKFQLLNPGLGFSVMGYDNEENPEATNNTKKDKIKSRQFIEDSDEDSDEDVDATIKDEEIGADQISTSVDIKKPDTKSTALKLNKYRKDQMQIRRKIHPFYVTPYSTDVILDVLYIYRDDYGHFVNIRNLHGLLDRAVRQNVDICRFCIQWRDRKNIQEHIENCRGLGRCKTIMPSHNLFFKNFWKTLPSPYTFFLDFECLLIKNIQIEDSANLNDGHIQLEDEITNLDDVMPKPKVKNTQILHNHKPSGYSWYCVNWKNEVVERVVYRQDPTSDDPERNEDVGKHCIRSMLNFAGEKLQEIEAYNKNAYDVMKFESEEHKQEIEIRLKENNFIKDDKPIDCCICNKPLHGLKSEENETEYVVEGKGNKKEKKQCVVKHHSHLPDYDFLGLAHSTPCNMNARIRKTFSCFAHNWTGYDSHIIVMAAENKELVSDIKLMGSSTEKITALTLNDVLRFCDSISFFGGASLDATVKSLGPEDFDIFRTELQIICSDRGLAWDELSDEFKQELFERLKDKGAFPYTYMDSFERFKETRLPPMNEFYNDLSECDIEESVYNNALRVWDMLNIQNLGEWHDLYVRIDTLLLSTCFVKLRKVMMDSFTLDVTQYVSLPSYTMDACLRHTKKTIELTKDPDVYIFLENAVLGGLCTIGDEKVALANNEYCGEQYDATKPKSWLVYLDKNNLYGASMITKLPVANYKFVPDSTLAVYNRNPNKYVNKLEDGGDYGQIWDVTLEYPEDKHDYFNSYPPAPSRKSVPEQKVSCGQRKLAVAFSVGKTAWATEKMIACLETKRVKCHYRALKLWIKLGVRITKVHKVLGFDQDDWMKDYVNYNSLQRSLTKNKVEQNLRKFLNNSLYGKQIQNVRDKINMVLLNSPEKRMRYAKKPTLKHTRILSENLVLAVIDRTSVTLNSNMGSGVVILEEARLNMYKFWYEFIKPNYPTASLLYSDTDSQVIKIECENVYDEMKKHSIEFDMSDYNPNHKIWGKYFDDTYKKTVNKMKDECSNSALTKFCALKSKLYSYESVQIDDEGRITGTNQEKKMKGVPRVAARRTKFEEYLECVEEPKQIFASFKTIRSKNHQLVTLQQSKKCLNRFDNKRFEITPSTSLALGHKDIPIYNSYEDYEWVNLVDYFRNKRYERKVFRQLFRTIFADQEKTVQEMVD